MRRITGDVAETPAVGTSQAGIDQHIEDIGNESVTVI